ncbi:MAG: hypothetical protein FJ388_26475, partial [Verrucomicrobia bacterium]|nr:hypothetical protein [Verrucomicrobiota bacterium]
MSRIEIRGIIVPSDFDGGWYASLIERGIITPESKFRRELAAAPAAEPLTVYVNSPGGSVFAGNEMVNAVLAWKAQTKQPVNVIVGAMAASMGAAFTIQAADTVAVHRNSLMMFHGAWGLQIGGAEAMHDYSEVLGKINAETKRVLLARYKLDEATVDEWLAEGREGWLTADEMKAAGIATEIIGVDDAALDLTDADLAEYEAKGLKIAALATGLAAMKGGANDGGKSAGDAGDGQGAADVQAGQDTEPDPANTTGAEYQAGLAAGRAEQFADIESKLAVSEDLCRKMQSDRDKARAEIERLSAANVALAEGHVLAVQNLETKHAAELADMGQKLAAVTARCERL